MEKNINKGSRNTIVGRDYIQNNMVPADHYIFNPQIIADIIDALYLDLQGDAAPSDDFYLMDLDEKNELNGIDEDFFSCIADCYRYFPKIDKLLKNPANKHMLEKYHSLLFELKGKITSDLINGKKLQDILPTIFDYAKINNMELFGEKSYWLNIFAYYMYTRCDIGNKVKGEKNVNAK